ncbi:MAG: class I adenylate-forming enzyme family protein, partial [Lautropia sp.]
MRAIDLLDHGLSRDPARLCVLDAPPQRGTTAPASAPFRFTHAEVRSLSHRIAGGLRAAGLRRGSRVAVYSSNCALAMVCMVGLLRAGAVWLPVNVRNPLQENLEFLRENRCEFVFCEHALLDDLARIRAAVPTARGAVLIGTARADGPHPWLLDWVHEFAEEFPDDEHGPEDLAWIKGTGGTTGRSKSVMIPQRSAVALFATTQICFPSPEPLLNLVAAPITHGAGNYALALMSGGAANVVIPRPDADAVLDAIEAHRISTLLLPPTLIYNILAHPGVRGRDFGSLRYFVVGAAPISPDRLAECIEVFGPVMTQVWGQTEAPMILTHMGPQDYAAARGRAVLKSCGRATPLARVAVMDDAGCLLPPGAMGELVARSDLVMQGYHAKPEETAAASRFGWHHTGDVGYRDVDGY